MSEQQPEYNAFWIDLAQDLRDPEVREQFAKVSTELSRWREDRGQGWYKDFGYALQRVLNQHIYNSHLIGAERPDDPGWHPCRCGWEGYYSDFHPHVADYLRATVLAVQGDR